MDTSPLLPAALVISVALITGIAQYLFLKKASEKDKRTPRKPE